MKDDSNRSLRRVNRKSRSAADRTVEVDSSAFFAEDPSPTPPPRKKPGSSAPRRSGAPAQAAAARPSVKHQHRNSARISHLDKINLMSAGFRQITAVKNFRRRQLPPDFL